MARWKPNQKDSEPSPFAEKAILVLLICIIGMAAVNAVLSAGAGLSPQLAHLFQEL